MAAPPHAAIESMDHWFHNRYLSSCRAMSPNCAAMETGIMPEGRRFEDENLAGSIFRDYSLAQSTFEDGDMTECIFSNVRLERARFMNVNMVGVAIEDAKIEGLTIFWA